MAKKKQSDSILPNHLASMIQPALGETFNPLTAREIAALETKFKAQLPALLKRLLMTYGAFSFTDYMYFSPKKRLPKLYSDTNQIVVDSFYGKMHKDFPRAKHIAIANVARIVAPYIPPSTLPIGDDGLGDLILIGTRGKYRGRVYLYDHELRGGGKHSVGLQADIYQLADSLEDFLLGLKPD